MKKLNNRGMTTVEVLVTFILIVVMVVSMYSTVSAYSAKRHASFDIRKSFSVIST